MFHTTSMHPPRGLLSSAIQRRTIGSLRSLGFVLATLAPWPRDSKSPRPGALGGVLLGGGPTRPAGARLGRVLRGLGSSLRGRLRAVLRVGLSGGLSVVLRGLSGLLGLRLVRRGLLA